MDLDQYHKRQFYLCKAQELMLAARVLQKTARMLEYGPEPNLRAATLLRLQADDKLFAAMLWQGMAKRAGKAPLVLHPSLRDAFVAFNETVRAPTPPSVPFDGWVGQEEPTK